MRLDSLAPLLKYDYWLVLACVLPLNLLVFVKLGLYRAVLRFTFYVLRFTFYVLRFTFYVLRFTFYVLRFTFYVI